MRVNDGSVAGRQLEKARQEKSWSWRNDEEEFQNHC